MKHSKACWSFFILLAAWIFYFWPIIYSIFQVKERLWITLSTYGITLATGYMVYARRKALKVGLFSSSQIGLLLLFLLVSVFVFANVVHMQYAEASSVMLMIPTLVLIAFGSAVIQTLIFPLLYLMLIIPLQDDTLQYRSVIVWVAVGVLITYLQYLKFYKSNVSFSEERASWILQNTRWLVPTGIAFGMLMASPWLGKNIRSFYPTKQMEIVMRAPLGTEGWRGPIPVVSKAWEPLYPNASAVLQAQYFEGSTSDQDIVYLYSAYFDSNRSFTEVLDPVNTIFDPSLWKKIDFKITEVDLGKNRVSNVFEVELQIGAISRLVWYWYYVAGFSTTDRTVAELLDNVRILAKYAQGSGIIAVSTTYNASPEEARKRLGSFLKTMYNSLDVVKRPEIIYTQYNHLGR